MEKKTGKKQARQVKPRPKNKAMMLSTEERRTLGIIADNGSRIASLALTKMTGKKVAVGLAWTEPCDIEKIPAIIGESHQLIDTAYLSIEGTFNGFALVIFPDEIARQAAGLLQGLSKTPSHLDKLGKSALKELANILTNGLLTSINESLETKSINTPPQFCQDMLNAVVSTVLTQYAGQAQQVLTLKTRLTISNQDTNATMLVVLDPESLDKFLKKVISCKKKSMSQSEITQSPKALR